MRKLNRQLRQLSSIGAARAGSEFDTPPTVKRSFFTKPSLLVLVSYNEFSGKIGDISSRESFDNLTMQRQLLSDLHDMSGNVNLTSITSLINYESSILLSIPLERIKRINGENIVLNE